LASFSWSFLLRLSLRTSFAGKNLRDEKLWDVNKFSIYCLIYLSLIFSPSGVYLLWAYPGEPSLSSFFLSLPCCRAHS